MGETPSRGSICQAPGMKLTPHANGTSLAPWGGLNTVLEGTAGPWRYGGDAPKGHMARAIGLGQFNATGDQQMPIGD